MHSILMRIFLICALAVLAKAQRFVRFISTDGREYTGDAILPSGTTDAFHSTTAKVIQGDILGNFTITNQVKPIKKLLSPLPNERVRTVRCVGFNYAAHDSEAGQPIPGWPILFFKPFTALNTPSDPIPITAGYQTQGNFTSTMDYETELVVVIKKKAFNISDEEALDHVLGFSVGHDVSHRGWQIDRGGEPQPQFSMGKGADGWAPWGPAIVSTNIIPDPQTLNIWTKVNGVTKQNDTTANMIFGVKHLVSFFSMGITLLPGDVIFTGTPSGVNLGKTDPVWLTDGDVVEVGLENVGNSSLANLSNLREWVAAAHGKPRSLFRLLRRHTLDLGLEEGWSDLSRMSTNSKLISFTCYISTGSRIQADARLPSAYRKEDTQPKPKVAAPQEGDRRQPSPVRESGQKRERKRGKCIEWKWEKDTR
ncbi:hypothetical protein H0H87_012763 [Tephrocybe sp. NHM501043]|nr:hypothetical protein H0H87_012763 [Tephrocybe sp. NHM501043]